MAEKVALISVESGEKVEHSFVQLNFLTSARLSLIRHESLTDLMIRESLGESVRLDIFDLV